MITRDELPKLTIAGDFIEVGVAAGKYSKILASYNPEHLYLLDSWEGYKYCNQTKQDKRYAKVLQMQSDRITVIKGFSNSEFALNMFPDNFFDLIYIDADHTYEAVKQDISNWYPKCKVGGLFSGHDYISTRTDFGVGRAVDEFCAEYGYKVNVTKRTKGIPESWYIIKQ